MLDHSLHADHRLVNPTLTHWGRVTHICVSKLTIIGSDNGLSPSWLQAIIWTNDGILLVGAFGTNFSEILIEIQTFSFWKNRFNVSSAKWRPFWVNKLMTGDAYMHQWTWVHSSPPKQNGHHFADDIFKCIFCNEKSSILFWISLKFLPKGPIDNKSVLVQVMPWCWIGDKPLPEPMLIQFTDAALGGDELSNGLELDRQQAITWTNDESLATIP